VLLNQRFPTSWRMTVPHLQVSSRPSRMSETTHPMTQCYMPEDLNPQHHHYEKHKPHNSFKFHWPNFTNSSWILNKSLDFFWQHCSMTCSSAHPIKCQTRNKVQVTHFRSKRVIGGVTTELR
jgi:hypothetical protein